MPSTKCGCSPRNGRLRRGHEFALEGSGEFMRQLLEGLNLSAGQHVLDVGFGGPEELETLAERVGPEGFVLGIEIDAERVRSASNTLSEDLPISVKEGSILNVPAEDGFFDIVLCKGVLHEVERLNRAFAELARVTRPGGQLFIVDFKRFSSVLFALYRLSVLVREGKCPDVWPGFREENLRAPLRRSGWELIEFKDLLGRGRLGFLHPALFLLKARRI